MTHSWFKVVTQSRILVPKENLTSSAGFGALSIPKKYQNLLAIIIFTKVSIFPLLMKRLLSRLKFTDSWLLYRIYSWDFTFLGVLQSASRNMIKKRVLGT